MKKAYFIISIIINIILLPIACGGLFVYKNDPTDFPLSLALAIPLIPLSFLIISIIALLKDIPIKKIVFPKLTVLLFLYGLSFLSFDEGYYAAILFSVAALVSLIVSIGLSKSVKSEKTINHDIRSHSPYCYKGEWTWEYAVDEYLKITCKNSINDLTDDDTRKVNRYTMMPIAYYFYWLFKKGFLINEVYKRFETKSDSDNIDVLTLLEGMDFCLHSDDMLEGASDFSRHYAELKYAQLHSDKLFFDYYDEIKNPEGYFYCVDFSWDVCERMYNRIDRAYERWSALFEHDSEYYEDYEYETELKKIYSKRFGKELEVYRSGNKISNNITNEYIRKCIDDLDSMDEYQFERLDRNISDDYGDSLKGEVIEKFQAFSVRIFEPQYDGDTAYIISGEADFEPEHGIAFYVRNGIIFSYGYDFDDIYSPENMRDYEVAANDIEFEKIFDKSQADELVNEGKLIKTYLVPPEAGGKDDESNMVYLTPLAVKEKELLDRKLCALMTLLKGKLKYTYTAIYYDDDKQFVPINIYVRHDVPPSACVFSFTVKVWY